jgi:uncharacterized PurR-regulated membrane protein YhhQ (DUF165 family)
VRIAVGVNDGPYRLRGATDAAWHTQGYSQRAGIGRWLTGALRAVLRIILPVVTLCTAFAALYLYMNTPVSPFADQSGKWLTVSHLILPAAFLMVHLTNRRYGPSYAFAQIVLSFGALGAASIFGGKFIALFSPAAVFPSVRLVASFVGAFLVAGFLSIIAFDGARGPRWWAAPLIGQIAAALAFAPIFYTAAFVGSGTPWLAHMSIHAGLLIAGAIASLLPFFLVRRLVQPLPGFGGF